MRQLRHADNKIVTDLSQLGQVAGRDAAPMRVSGRYAQHVARVDFGRVGGP